jgi:hypothetical protein
LVLVSQEIGVKIGAELFLVGGILGFEVRVGNGLEALPFGGAGLGGLSLEVGKGLAGKAINCVAAFRLDQGWDEHVFNMHGDLLDPIVEGGSSRVNGGVEELGEHSRFDVSECVHLPIIGLMDEACMGGVEDRGVGRADVISASHEGGLEIGIGRESGIAVIEASHADGPGTRVFLNQGKDRGKGGKSLGKKAEMRLIGVRHGTEGVGIREAIGVDVGHDPAKARMHLEEEVVRDSEPNDVWDTKVIRGSEAT